jgi:hypothetical protein
VVKSTSPLSDLMTGSRMLLRKLNGLHRPLHKINKTPIALLVHQNHLAKLITEIPESILQIVCYGQVNTLLEVPRSDMLPP